MDGSIMAVGPDGSLYMGAASFQHVTPSGAIDTAYGSNGLADTGYPAARYGRSSTRREDWWSAGMEEAVPSSCACCRPAPSTRHGD